MDGLPTGCLASFHIILKSPSDNTFSCAKVVQATFGKGTFHLLRKNYKGVWDRLVYFQIPYGVFNSP